MQEREFPQFFQQDHGCQCEHPAQQHCSTALDSGVLKFTVHPQWVIALSVISSRAKVYDLKWNTAKTEVAVQEVSSKCDDDCGLQQSYTPTSATQEPWEENNYAKQPSAGIMCAYGIFTNSILAHISRHRCAQRQPPLLTTSWKFMAHPPNQNKTNKYDAVTDHSCTQMVVSQWGFANCPWHHRELYGVMHTYGWILLDSFID